MTFPMAKNEYKWSVSAEAFSREMWHFDRITLKTLQFCVLHMINGPVQSTKVDFSRGRRDKSDAFWNFLNIKNTSVWFRFYRSSVGSGEYGDFNRKI